MGLWGKAALGAGLSKVAGSYMKGQKEKQFMESQELQNKYQTTLLKQAEAQVSSAKTNSDLQAKLASLGGLGSGKDTDVPTPETDTPPTPTEGTGKTSPTALNAKTSDSTVPEGVPTDDEDKLFYQPESFLSKQKEEWKETYSKNQEVIEKSIKIKKAKDANAKSGAVKGSPNYNADADLTPDELTSKSGSIQTMTQKLTKVQEVEDVLKKTISDLEAKAKQTGNDYFLVEANRVRTQYYPKIVEMRNKGYMEGLTLAAESKDEAAFNTLASIIGLTGDRSQTFDYDEKNGKWQVLNGDGSLAFETDEIVMALTDVKKFGELGQKIRQASRDVDVEIEKQRQLTQQAQSSGDVPENVKQFLNNNKELGKTLPLGQGQMFVDDLGVFGTGQSTPIFMTKQDVSKLKEGTHPNFIDKNEKGKAILGPSGKMRFRGVDGKIYEFSEDYFKKGQFLNYNPDKVSVTTIINNMGGSFDGVGKDPKGPGNSTPPSTRK